MVGITTGISLLSRVVFSCIACIYVFYFIFRFASCKIICVTFLYFHLFYFFTLLIANKRLY